MKEYLEKHDMKITVSSPVYIGSGAELTKKEYIFLPGEGKIIVPDQAALFSLITRRGKEKAFEDFLLGYSVRELGRWLIENGFDRSDYDKVVRYTIDAGKDVITETSDRRDSKVKGISCFMRDAYGKPYVPGSSIKGMLRTALLSYEIERRRNDFSESALEIEGMSKKTDGHVKPSGDKRYLKKQIGTIETTAFRTLDREDPSHRLKADNAVNDVLSGLRITDSEPIDENRLTLSQKVDIHLNGEAKYLPLLRETLMPGTEILFRITIDTGLCKYTIQDIFDALSLQNELMNKYFYSKFRRESKNRDTVWLGGGIGFSSKTVVNALLKEKALPVTDTILKNVLGNRYEEHKHYEDVGLGVAPHVCKCTRYHGQIVNMGMGRISEVSCEP